ncbi:MAG: acetylhydrolase [Halioglobus sp.]
MFIYLRSFCAATIAALVLSACQGQNTADEGGESPVGASPPFAVGSSTLYIHDDSRPFDTVAGVNTGVRTLVTEVWYPVEHNDISDSSVRATYGDYVFGSHTLHQKMMTKTTFFHLTPETVREGVTSEQIQQSIDELFVRPRGSFVDAPVAAMIGKLPVIVMSHGDAGSRYNMQSVCEYLASFGYLVIAPEHTGNSPYTATGKDPALAGDDPSFESQMSDVLPLLDADGAYGQVALYGQSYSPLAGDIGPAAMFDLDRALVERVNDLRAVLDTLDRMNQQGEFASLIDLSRIGLMGRSFGGATTLAGLMLEDRFSAGFAVVPPAFPDFRNALPADALVPPGIESAILSASGDNALTSLHKPTMLLLGGEDDLILGLGYQLGKAMGGPVPSPENPYPVLKTTVQESDMPSVMALVPNTNHGSFGVSGPYWWPALKPNRFPGFFNPDEEFILLDSEVAHRMQREMALKFFDITLREDKSRLGIFRDNPWQEYGVTVDIRGF